MQYHRMRRYQRFGMETNQFQQFLADELRRRSGAASVHVPVADINHSSDKLGRIQRLQPLITSGTLRFSRRHVTLVEQLRQFPFGRPRRRAGRAGDGCLGEQCGGGYARDHQRRRR